MFPEPGRRWIPAQAASQAAGMAEKYPRSARGEMDRCGSGLAPGRGEYLVPVKVVSTSALPIDLAAQVSAVLPGTVVEVPARGHVGLAGVDLASADALVCL